MIIPIFFSMFLGVEAGVAGEFSRQRNVFPLPEIPDGGEGPNDLMWRVFANQGIKTLNEITGCVNSEFHKRQKPTRVQRRVQQQILDAYVKALPEPTVSSAGGLVDLCSSARLYDSGGCIVQPYAKDNISWPQASSQPVPLDGCLAAADREWLGSWQQHMLRSSSDKTFEKVTPYIDPVLKNNPAEYAHFLQELHQRSMIGFRVAEGGETGKLGIFFVPKKSGQLRLIFDTRLLNQDFHDPPSTDLPSADSFSRIELPQDQQFFIGSGDLSNAFYTLSVPAELGKLFTLPCIEAGAIGIDCIDGDFIRPGSRLLPYLTVLPMGWSWALHLCQLVLINAIRKAGIPEQCIVGDKRNPVQIENSDQIAVAGYVDNFGAFGVSADAVNAGLRAIAKQLREWGLSVHEEVEAQSTGEFVGLYFDGNSGHMSIKQSRIAKIRAGIHDLLNRQFCSGHTIQLVLGHITWALMARREGLALINSCYAFVHKNIDKQARLWPSVRKELEWVATLLPLFRIRLNIGWSEDVTASDSSPWGVGVCSRKLDVKEVRNLGSFSERWRFKFEDAMRARQHALGQSQHETNSSETHITDVKSFAPSGGFCGSNVFSENPSGHRQPEVNNVFISDGSFQEIGPEILNKNDWTVIWSRPWKFEANILNTEARALLWSIEHLLRANRCLNRRLLCFSDNLPLVLATAKGRAKSKHLIKPLRQLAGLSLATGSRIAVRWVVSELNPADAPSRALHAWKARGFERWWDDVIDPEYSNFEPPVKQPAGTESCFERSGTLPSADSSSSKITRAPRDDLPGVTKCAAAHSQGLHKSQKHISEVVSGSWHGDSHGTSAGPSPSRISRVSVQRRHEDRQWHQDPCSHEIFQSSSWSSKFRKLGSDSESFERLESCGSAHAKVAPANRSAWCDHWATNPEEPHGDWDPPAAPIHLLSTSRRVFKPYRETVGASSAISGNAVPVLGSASSPSGRGGARQDQCLRCHSPDRHRAVVEPILQEADRSQGPRRSSLDSSSRDGGQQLPHLCRRARPDSIGNLPVHTTTRRCHSRHHRQEKVHVGSQAARSVGSRLIAKEIRQAGQVAIRDEQDPKPHPDLRSQHLGHIASPNQSEPSQRASVWNPNITRRMQQKSDSTKNVSNLKKSEYFIPRLQEMTGAQVLKKKFRLALKNAGSPSRKIFLDLFSGDGGISKCLRQRGHAVVDVDIANDSRLDLCDPTIFSVIEGWIRSRCIHGVWLATVCKTWSRARHGPFGSSWGPLRTNHHIYGLPGLSAVDRHKLLIGNRTMRVTARIIDLCIQYKVPCYLENPAGSMIWLAPPIAKHCNHVSSRQFITDFCQHGARWRKRTRIQTWNAQECIDLNVCCSGHKGLCSRTGKRHIILKGQDPVSKQLWTHLAQPYPLSFCHKAAKTMIHSADCIDNFHLSKWFGI